MTQGQLIPSVDRETTLSNPFAAEGYGEVPKSELLEESATDALFATFFESTWSHQEVSGPEREHLGWDIDFWSTPIYGDQSSFRRLGVWRSRGEPSQPDPVQKPNSDRVTLLARKYVAGDQFSNEQDARLAIVTEQVRKLLPAVTEQDVEALEGVLQAIKEVQQSDEKIRSKLRIASKKNG